MKSDWPEAAVYVMFASVFIAVFSGSGWRKIGFWMSLVISSAIQVVVVHAWVRRLENLNPGQGKLATKLGLVLFFAV